MDFNIDSYLSSFRWENFKSIYQDKKNHLPLIGKICYCSYNLHMSLDGGLPSIMPMIGSRSLNLILLTSHIGIGYHINQQKCIQQQCDDHIILSSYASILFNLGSFLFTAIMKNFLPQSQLIRGIFSLFISLMNIHLGGKFLKKSIDHH